MASTLTRSWDGEDEYGDDDDDGSGEAEENDESSEYIGRSAMTTTPRERHIYSSGGSAVSATSATSPHYVQQQWQHHNGVDRPPRLRLKLTLIGSAGVGKTTLARMVGALSTMRGGEWGTLESRFRREASSTRPTLSVDYVPVLLRPGTSALAESLSVTLWDTGGMERFASLTRTFVRDSAAILLVYDSARPETFNALVSQWQEVAREELTRAMAAQTSAPIVFVIRNERRGAVAAVAFDDADAYARTIGAAAHMSVDAMSPAIVDVVFSNIGTWLEKNRSAFERDARVREQRTATCVVFKTSWEAPRETVPTTAIATRRKVKTRGCCM